MNIYRVLIKVNGWIMLHNIIIHSCQWNNKGIMKQNNAIVAYARSGKVDYGIIKIAVINNDNPTQTIVIISKLNHRPLEQSCIVPHIFVCSTPTQCHDVVTVKIVDVYGPCILMACTVFLTLGM